MDFNFKCFKIHTFSLPIFYDAVSLSRVFLVVCKAVRCHELVVGAVLSILGSLNGETIFPFLNAFFKSVRVCLKFRMVLESSIVELSERVVYFFRSWRFVLGLPVVSNCIEDHHGWIVRMESIFFRSWMPLSVVLGFVSGIEVY